MNTIDGAICPNCGSKGLSVFYEATHVPVHSVLLMPSRERALSYPHGDIRLGACDACGFIVNVAFDPTVHEYSVGYEATQSFSPTFNRFNTQLAQDLIKRYHLHGKHIIEIGCGQGEFLKLLCELGNNNGTGFDPAYDPNRPGDPTTAQIEFVQDFYSEKYRDTQGNFICCKMTLEHIFNTAEFVSTVRRSIADRLETVVFFQVPNATYVMRDIAFWDIYYEHCSYFSAGSLAYLFERCGFQVLDVATQYSEQYLTIEARPVRQGGSRNSRSVQQAVLETKQHIRSFTASYPARLTYWRETFETIRSTSKRTVIWGSGSKGVAFLTTVGVPGLIEYAVDVNPHRHGTFMPGIGVEIVGPAFLQDYRPDSVIVMNPIYCGEIQKDLETMGISAQLMPV
jgi:hypothetical protein